MFRKRADIPIYSFAKHAREIETTSIYSPHVLILEGIFALYDPRVLKLLDMKVCYVIPELRMRTRTLKTKLLEQIFCEADADTCLSRRSMSIYFEWHSFASLPCTMIHNTLRAGQRLSVGSRCFPLCIVHHCIEFDLIRVCKWYKEVIVCQFLKHTFSLVKSELGIT